MNAALTSLMSALMRALMSAPLRARARAPKPALACALKPSPACALKPSPACAPKPSLAALARRWGVFLALVLLPSILASTGSFAYAADGDFIAVPALRAHVTDLTATLSDADRSALERKLAEWEGRRGAQFAVLIVPTTKPDTIDEYSQRVTDEWRIGRKGVDDGVLLLIAKDDKRLRIQVGKGFEGSLTDVTAKRIIDEVMVPFFRRGDYAGGIDAGVDRVIAVVAGEVLPPKPPPPKSHTTNWNFDWIEVALVFGFALFGVLASVLNRLFGRIGGSLVGGGIAGAVAWFVTSIMLVAIGAGVVVFVVLLLALATRGAGIGPGSRGGWSGGGFGSGGFGGFGGFGGSSGGSSWSGGGGDFGGGGASGSWGGSSGGSDS